jgi:hypothetical protein
MRRRRLHAPLRLICVVLVMPEQLTMMTLLLLLLL